MKDEQEKNIVKQCDNQSIEVGKIKTLKKLNFEFFLGVIQDLET